MNIQQRLERVLKTLDDTFISESFVQDLPVLKTPNSFNNKNELANALTEGAMLNITRVGGSALSIPAGQYLIWASDEDNTQLIRTEDVSRYSETFDRLEDTVEVSTKQLLNNYHSIEKVLAEDAGAEEAMSQNRKIDRSPIYTAMKNNDMSEQDLADAVGVHRSHISRLMRKPHDQLGSGDPGGRNPSIEVAGKMAAVLKTGIENLFPDLLQKKQGKRRKSTRTSGKVSGGKLSRGSRPQ